MASSAFSEEKGRNKRDADGSAGKDLLVAYLSDVGGYDRQYRDVSDENENGSGGKLSNLNIKGSLGYHLLTLRSCRRELFLKSYNADTST